MIDRHLVYTFETCLLPELSGLLFPMALGGATGHYGHVGHTLKAACFCCPRVILLCLHFVLFEAETVRMEGSNSQERRGIAIVSQFLQTELKGSHTQLLCTAMILPGCGDARC